MKLIRPADITTSNLTSDVPITETEWSAGTYSTGTQRYVDTTLYEVVASPSTDDDPTVGVLADPQTWIEVGEINRWKMFSGVIEEQTVQTGSIEVTITPGVVFDAITLFNVEASTVQVTVEDPTDGVVYDKTINLIETASVEDWFDYFFNPIEQATQDFLNLYDPDDPLFDDIPAYGTADVTVTIDNGTNDAKVGELVIGRQQILGQTSYGTAVSIIDYSRKETDTFGRSIVIERPFSKRVEYDFKFETNQINGILTTLANYRATPIVYIGADDEPATVVYGYYRDFQLLYSTPSLSEGSLEVEGLT